MTIGTTTRYPGPDHPTADKPAVWLSVVRTMTATATGHPAFKLSHDDAAKTCEAGGPRCGQQKSAELLDVAVTERPMLEERGILSCCRGLMLESWPWS